MSYRYVDVKRYKRGASWPDGQPRLCTRCGVEQVRRKRAVVVANLKYSGAKTKVPVSYCESHVPDALVD